LGGGKRRIIWQERARGERSHILCVPEKVNVKRPDEKKNGGKSVLDLEIEERLHRLEETTEDG